MFKQAWRSYLASLHPRNYKYIKNPMIEYIWFWFIINSLVIDHGAEKLQDYILQTLFGLTMLLPFFIMWWSNLNHKLSIPKQMYLIPMKMDERREYFNTLLLIKIGFPILVGILLQLIQAAIYGIDWLQIILTTVGLISFGIGMYVCSELRSKFDRYIRYAVRGKDGTGKDAWLNWMCMTYSVFYMIGAMVAEVPHMGVVEWIWTLVFLGLLLVLDIAIIKTRYYATIEDVCNYEEAYNVLGKVKK